MHVRTCTYQQGTEEGGVTRVACDGVKAEKCVRAESSRGRSSQVLAPGAPGGGRRRGGNAGGVHEDVVLDILPKGSKVAYHRPRTTTTHVSPTGAAGVRTTRDVQRVRTCVHAHELV